MRGSSSVPLAAAAILLGFCSGRTWAQSPYNRNYCPEACTKVGSAAGNWNVYSSVDRLSWCDQTMLVSFNIHTNPDATTLRLGACTVGDATSTSTSSSQSSEVDAPDIRASRRRDLAARDTSPDAATASKSTPKLSWLLNTSDVVNVQKFSYGTNGSALAADVVLAANALQQQLSVDGGVANQTLLIAYSKGAVVGVYSGARIEDTSTNDLLQQLIETFQGNGSSTAAPNTAVHQVCGDDRSALGVLGVVAYAGPRQTGLGMVQGALAKWSNATCVSQAFLAVDDDGEVNGEGSSPKSAATNSSLVIHQSPFTPAVLPSTNSARAVPRAAEASCREIQVVAGDGCASLATRCGITPAQFTSYNPSSTECSTLTAGEWVCCSTGTLPSHAPPPGSDGTCATYYVNMGDDCNYIAASHSLTVATLNSLNTNTWGWTGCNPLASYINICLSTGNPPLPAPVSNAVCGPLVPGTKAPAAGKTLASLNPCLLNACCDIWGQCGITSEFCTISKSTTGAPGTAALNQNGCISNCGTAIVYSAGPAEFISVGYFEGFNWNRRCLNMEATSIPSTYTHIHFAFANLTSDYDLDLGDQMIQWELFVGSTGFKKIISIGGWAFSTDPSTYNIFRTVMATEASRGTLIKNIVNFINQYGLDGVDIDWEYPGAPDIPGIPPSTSADGLNYFIFLAELRGALPSPAIISIAAPASYWYLKGFLIEAYATTLDYIVYETYDLHGQWDYANKYSDPGCPTGNCLRSHVNTTEINLALAMITKAGVPTNQLALGVTSYGRSFQMVDRTCTGPECLFTGPKSGAEPGPCTNTAGYISNAELNLIIANTSIAKTQYLDSVSDSNILIWDDNWVAYMDDSNKATRTLIWKAHSFGGTADWAIDLEASLTADDIPPLTVDQTGNEICNMDYFTGNDVSLADAGTIANTTWSVSGAEKWLGEFLNELPDLTSWTLAFFNKTTGGANFDCGDLAGTTCGSPYRCITYDPPEAFFVHQQISQLYSTYKTFVTDIINNSPTEIGKTIDDISSTFAPPDTTSALLLSILGGILGTMTGFGTFIGDAGPESSLGVLADGLGAISSLASDAALGLGAPTNDPTENLESIYGTIIGELIGAMNATLERLFNTQPHDPIVTVSYIEGFFKDGAFINPGLTDVLKTNLYSAFNITLNQYLVIAAMKTISFPPPNGDGYALLISSNQYADESSCTPDTAPPGMHWYNNTCIGFGRYSDYAEASVTFFLDPKVVDLMKLYIPDLDAAAENNYNCYLNPTQDGNPDFPAFSLDTIYGLPACFYNFPVWPIMEIS